jgi:hypothetical protein
LKNLFFIVFLSKLPKQFCCYGIASGAIIGGIKGGIKSGLAIQDAAKKIYNEAKAEYEEEKKEAQS